MASPAAAPDPRLPQRRPSPAKPAAADSCQIPVNISSYPSSQTCSDQLRAGGNRCEEDPAMRTLSPALAMIALAGFCGQADAQSQCPELTRLRSEATGASKPMGRALTSDLCEAYIR